MNRLLRMSLVAAAFAVPVMPAQATPAFDPGLNRLFFNNFENLYRPTENCAANDNGGGCLPFQEGNDPTGWQRVDPFLANNVHEGDVFAGILNVQEIRNSGSQIYFSTPTDQFTGYFAQEVVDVAAGVHGGSLPDHLTLGNPTVDPFSILAAGESFRFWVDQGLGATAFNSGSSNALFDTVPELIAIATDGILWAGLGIGAGEPANGYAYAHTNLGLAGNLAEPSAFVALDLVTIGPAYNAGALVLINDGNEDEVGGFLAPVTAPCSPAQIAAGLIACTHFVATSEIEFNPDSASGSPFFFGSNDPAEVLQAAPEPGTLSLVALVLIGLGAVSRRRS